MTIISVNMDCYLKLIEIIAVLSIFNHSTKYQQPCAIADKPIGSTTWRNITTYCWDEPLVCSYKYKKDNQVSRHFPASSTTNLIDTVDPKHKINKQREIGSNYIYDWTHCCALSGASCKDLKQGGKSLYVHHIL